eukprot:1395173-Amorphochlora_amoeboformis.AAC.1
MRLRPPTTYAQGCSLGSLGLRLCLEELGVRVVVWDGLGFGLESRVIATIVQTTPLCSSFNPSIQLSIQSNML